MLTLTEQQEISTLVESLDAQFTDDIIDAAEFYEVEEDPITLQTKITIFDANGGVLSTATVEDYDTAVAYMEETFDLEEYDEDEIDADAAAGSTRWGQ